MPLPAGARLGPYEIVSLIGVGGMGEVYKARDTRLQRPVAIKLLHEDAAERPDRRARFETEARAISSLGHPHICTLFDVGDENGRAFLVMEYLEGETLEDRLTSGPLSPEDATRYAIQIADALCHAHGAHIIHRDLKPSNVMLTASGVKLLDFGLAKRPAIGSPGESSTQSFEQRRLTAEGTLVGTFQYMAPEQLEGKDVDARTDIFAFGTLLYEMATGQKAFHGKSQASLIAAILTEQPPPISSALPAKRKGELFGLDHLLERCLAKNPDERWQSARDLKHELEWIAGSGGRRTMPRASNRRLHIREAAAWSFAVVAAVGAAALAFLAFRPVRGEMTQFVVAPPQDMTIGVAENRTRMALSPDGRRLAMVVFTGGAQQIWVRSLDSLQTQPLAGTEGAVSPFWSPDSRYVGFFSPGDGELKKIEAIGGPVRTICAAQTDGAAVWGRDGILFTEFPGGGIRHVAAEGGTPVQVTRIDKSRKELNHYWPEFLPDGRRFLYMSTGLNQNGLRATPTVFVASLDSPGATPIAQVHSRAMFVAPNHVLFVQDGVLLAQEFDAKSLTVSGEPIRVADGLAFFRTLGNGGFSVSSNGVLAYQGSTDPFSLVWYDRRGNAEPAGWPQQEFGGLRIAPGGARLAVDVVDPRTGTADIWIYDIDRGGPVRFTTEPTSETQPVWSFDGRRILYRSERGGSPNLYGRTIGTGSDELLVTDPSPLQPEDWSGDGRWIAYVRNTRQTARDLWLMPLDGERKPLPFSATRFEEWGARFSPDSRWIAFVSTETGAPEVYVAPAGEAGARRRISTGGGTSPRWRRDGRELFYASADGRSIIAVPVRPGPAFAAGVPERLFTIAVPAARDRSRNSVYDVLPDGQRFIVSVPAGEATSSRITVVLNWTNAFSSGRSR